MTAEICILNRHGVAIAADSAVTIGRNKVYNSANKLFALSKYHPIGIMIYGGASFMDIPWEIIIKDFRSKIGISSEAKLRGYKDSFFEYIKHDERLKNLNYEKLIVKETFDKALVSVLGKNLGYIDGKLANMEDINEEVEEKLQNYIQEEIIEVRSEYTEILEISLQTFRELYSDIIKIVGNKRLGFAYNDETEYYLCVLAHEVTIRNYFTRSVTGVVFVGYGEEELFPSLYSYKIDGFINGQLKCDHEKERHIHSGGFEEGHDDSTLATAAVIPFAQSEMVQLFMKGIDPFLQNSIYDTIENLINKYGDIIKDHTDIELDSEDVLKINQLGNSLVSEIFNQMNKHQRQKITLPIIEIVDILPKEELAEMAETLINLTSFKRRMSIDTETVGGPIDVAVITKGDGFVWIKRKHYFDKELNHSFFNNYFGRDINDIDIAKQSRQKD